MGSSLPLAFSVSLAFVSIVAPWNPHVEDRLDRSWTVWGAEGCLMLMLF